MKRRRSRDKICLLAVVVLIQMLFLSACGGSGTTTGSNTTGETTEVTVHNVVISVPQGLKIDVGPDDSQDEVSIDLDDSGDSWLTLEADVGDELIYQSIIDSGNVSHVEGNLQAAFVDLEVLENSIIDFSGDKAFYYSFNGAMAGVPLHGKFYGFTDGSMDYTMMAFTPVDAPDEVLALIDQLVGSVVIKR